MTAVQVVVRCRECGEIAEYVTAELCRKHYNRAHYQRNRERAKARTRAWHLANPERSAEQRRRRDPAMLRAIAKRWYWNDPERARSLVRTWIAAHPEVWKATQRRYRQTYPDRLRAKNHRRRARQLSAEGDASEAQIIARVAYFGFRCWMCGAPWSCLDHVKPLAKGGSNWPSNLRPACQPCNSRKNATWEGVASLCRF